MQRKRHGCGNAKPFSENPKMVNCHEMQDVWQDDIGSGKHPAGIRTGLLGRDASGKSSDSGG